MCHNIIKMLCLLTIAGNVVPYRWSVLEDDDEDLNVCNNQKCGDRVHSSCAANQKPSKLCKDFKILDIGRQEIEYIINGHNGIRNRVANNYQKPASNMNLIHWDNDLHDMAKGWIIECIVNQDNCNFIYNSSLTVGQNIQYEENLPERYWTIKIIREWFLSGNNIEDHIIDKYESEKDLSFTQLVWAHTEFVGCAAAMMNDGYMMACNYHPKGNINGEPVYKTGKPCTDCALDRPSCSRIFKGLCGIDRGSGHRIIRYPFIIIAISFSVICL